MAVRVTAAHTAEARAEAGREAGDGGVAAAAAAALAPSGFLGLPAPFSEEGNRAGRARARPGWGRLRPAAGGPGGLRFGRDRPFQTRFFVELTSPQGPSRPCTSPRVPRSPGPLLRDSHHPLGPRCPPTNTHRCPSHGGCPCRCLRPLLPPALFSGPRPGPSPTPCLGRALPSSRPPHTASDRSLGPWPGCGWRLQEGGASGLSSPGGRQQSPVVESCRALCPSPAPS